MNEIIVSNQEEFINHTKQALLEMLSEAEDKAKQDVLDVIEKFIYNLSNTAESVIEHAKNGTTDVLDKSLGKMRHEVEIFVEHIVTNQFFIMVSIFILITLFSAAGYLFRRLSKDYHFGRLFEVLSNMILIITSLLTFLWFGLVLVWFFERAIDDKDPFYIIVTIILFLASFYGICHLCWVLKTKILVGWKWLHEKISKSRTVDKHKHEDSVLPTVSELSNKY